MYDTEGKIECYFIIFSIPILVGYILLMVPNSIPDEIVHFTKAYLTSEFKLGVSPYAYVPKDYSVLTHYNYFEWRELIFHTTNYSDVVKMETCNYNFIAYLIPSFGLMVGRLFEFSITFSYLLARLLNSLVFITFGYHAIKRIPFAKWILLVYLLSPMILQQAGSLSADNLINCVAIFSISYCLYLFKSENEIENKDIIILGCCLCAITITKYIYLPLFGLLFLSYKKIFRIEKRMWFYVLLVFISVAAAYYYFNIYLVSIGEIPEQSAQVKYLKDAGVNSSAQISNMISNPLALLKAIIYTSWNNRMYYLYSMLVTPLSWLTMNIDVFYFYFYSSILGIAILSEEGKNLFKNKFQKVWILTIALMIIITIFVSFYVVFTTVGGTNIEGIQGRYFIPVGLILLILLIGKKKLYLKNPGKIMIVMLYILQLVTMNTMLTFFR